MVGEECLDQSTPKADDTIRHVRLHRGTLSGWTTLVAQIKPHTDLRKQVRIDPTTTKQLVSLRWGGVGRAGLRLGSVMAAVRVTAVRVAAARVAAARVTAAAVAAARVTAARVALARVAAERVAAARVAAESVPAVRAAAERVAAARVAAARLAEERVAAARVAAERVAAAMQSANESVRPSVRAWAPEKPKRLRPQCLGCDSWSMRPMSQAISAAPGRD